MRANNLFSVSILLGCLLSQSTFSQTEPATCNLEGVNLHQILGAIYDHVTGVPPKAVKKPIDYSFPTPSLNDLIWELEAVGIQVEVQRSDIEFLNISDEQLGDAEAADFAKYLYATDRVLLKRLIQLQLDMRENLGPDGFAEVKMDKNTKPLKFKRPLKIVLSRSTPEVERGPDAVIRTDRRWNYGYKDLESVSDTTEIRFDIDGAYKWDGPKKIDVTYETLERQIRLAEAIHRNSPEEVKPETIGEWMSRPSLVDTNTFKIEFESEVFDVEKMDDNKFDEVASYFEQQNLLDFLRAASPFARTTVFVGHGMPSEKTRDEKTPAVTKSNYGSVMINVTVYGAEALEEVAKRKDN